MITTAGLLFSWQGVEVVCGDATCQSDDRINSDDHSDASSCSLIGGSNSKFLIVIDLGQFAHVNAGVWLTIILNQGDTISDSISEHPNCG